MSRLVHPIQFFNELRKLIDLPADAVRIDIKVEAGCLVEVTVYSHGKAPDGDQEPIARRYQLVEAPAPADGQEGG